MTTRGTSSNVSKNFDVATKSSRHVSCQEQSTTPPSFSFRASKMLSARSSIQLSERMEKNDCALPTRPEPADDYFLPSFIFVVSKQHHRRTWLKQKRHLRITGNEIANCRPHGIFTSGSLKKQSSTDSKFTSSSYANEMEADEKEDGSSHPSRTYFVHSSRSDLVAMSSLDDSTRIPTKIHNHSEILSIDLEDYNHFQIHFLTDHPYHYITPDAARISVLLYIMKFEAVEPSEIQCEPWATPAVLMYSEYIQALVRWIRLLWKEGIYLQSKEVAARVPSSQCLTRELRETFEELTYLFGLFIERRYNLSEEEAKNTQSDLQSFNKGTPQARLRAQISRLTSLKAKGKEFPLIHHMKSVRSSMDHLREQLLALIETTMQKECTKTQEAAYTYEQSFEEVKKPATQKTSNAGMYDKYQGTFMQDLDSESSDSLMLDDDLSEESFCPEDPPESRNAPNFTNVVFHELCEYLSMAHHQKGPTHVHHAPTPQPLTDSDRLRSELEDALERAILQPFLDLVYFLLRKEESFALELKRCEQLIAKKDRMSAFLIRSATVETSDPQSNTSASNDPAGETMYLETQKVLRVLLGMGTPPKCPIEMQRCILHAVVSVMKSLQEEREKKRLAEKSNSSNESPQNMEATHVPDERIGRVGRAATLRADPDRPMTRLRRAKTRKGSSFLSDSKYTETQSTSTTALIRIGENGGGTGRLSFAHLTKELLEDFGRDMLSPQGSELVTQCNTYEDTDVLHGLHDLKKTDEGNGESKPDPEVSPLTHPKPMPSQVVIDSEDLCLTEPESTSSEDKLKDKAHLLRAHEEELRKSVQKSTKELSRPQNPRAFFSLLDAEEENGGCDEDELSTLLAFSPSLAMALGIDVAADDRDHFDVSHNVTRMLDRTEWYQNQKRSSMPGGDTSIRITKDDFDGQRTGEGTSQGTEYSQTPPIVVEGKRISDSTIIQETIFQSETMRNSETAEERECESTPVISCSVMGTFSSKRESKVEKPNSTLPFGADDVLPVIIHSLSRVIAEEYEKSLEKQRKATGIAGTSIGFTFVPSPVENLITLVTLLEHFADWYSGTELVYYLTLFISAVRYIFEESEEDREHTNETGRYSIRSMSQHM